MIAPQWNWLIRVLTWDGLLPIVVLLATFFLRIADPRNDSLLVVAVVLLPFVAAMIRSHLAWNQIAQACHGQVPILRQLAVACAIVFLLLFEISATALTMAKDAPSAAWLFSGGCYLTYLLAIIWSLQPAPVPEIAPCDF